MKKNWIKYCFSALFICLFLIQKSVSATQIQGDFRLRYQTQRKESESASRDRIRYRLRLKSDASISDDLQFKIGLASGVPDARSSNQTFEKSFQKYPITIDYAYAVMSPFENVQLLAGKMQNPIWQPGDVFWDTDINPDGAALMWEEKNVGDFDLFMTAGYFMMDELMKGGKAGTNLVAVQPGFIFNIDRDAALKTSATFYQFNNINGAILDNGAAKSGINNSVSGGKLTNDFRIAELSSELGVNNFLTVPYFGISWTIFKNTAAASSNYGGLLGLTVGEKKIKKAGKWQLLFNYRFLLNDAWPDVLPDSDSYGGATGIKGGELIFNYMVTDSTIVSVDFNIIERADGSDPEKLLQIDWNLKF